MQNRVKSLKKWRHADKQHSRKLEVISAKLGLLKLFIVNGTNTLTTKDA